MSRGGRVATAISMKRKLYLPIVLVVLGLLLPRCAKAQSDDANTPLGDVARAMRKSKPLAAHTIIDNDNLSQIMQEVESRKLTGTRLLFSFDSVGKSFQVSSPDVTCSLSFSAQATALLSDPFVPRNLPKTELVKLDGPAAISGDSLQVAIFNGTVWDLREITVGLTILRRPAGNAAYYGVAKLLPAAAETAEPAVKRSDTTVLYHIKGTAAPFTNSIFRAPLGLTISPDQEWHWAIVEAQGIPPK